MFKKILIGACLVVPFLATSAFAQDTDAQNDAVAQQCIQVATIYANIAQQRDNGVDENIAFADIVDANYDTMTHDELDQVYHMIDAIYVHTEVAPDDIGNMVLQECVGE
jgi:hypothetical protein